MWYKKVHPSLCGGDFLNTAIVPIYLQRPFVTMQGLRVCVRRGQNLAGTNELGA